MKVGMFIRPCGHHIASWRHRPPAGPGAVWGASVPMPARFDKRRCPA